MLLCERAPEDPALLRVLVNGEDLRWRWRLSGNPVAVDWLLQGLRGLSAPALGSQPEIVLRSLHAMITARVREHWVPGDVQYEEPRQFEESIEDRRYDHLERNGSGTIAQVLARQRWRHEREVRWLQHEIDMLRRELGKEERRDSLGGMPRP